MPRCVAFELPVGFPVVGCPRYRVRIHSGGRVDSELCHDMPIPYDCKMLRFEYPCVVVRDDNGFISVPKPYTLPYPKLKTPVFHSSPLVVIRCSLDVVATLGDDVPVKVVCPDGTCAEVPVTAPVWVFAPFAANVVDHYDTKEKPGPVKDGSLHIWWEETEDEMRASSVDVPHPSVGWSD